MIHLVVKVLPVALSISLVASCFLSCYTFAYAEESQEVENVFTQEQEEIVGDSSGFELAPGSVELVSYAADGRAAAEGHGADDGAAEGSIEDTSSDYGGLVLTSELPLYSARAASAADVVGQTWGSVKDTVSASWGLVKDYLTWFYDGGTSWQTNISTADKVKIIPQFTTLNLLKQQWGYNYGTGNTIVWAKNSPAGWLYSINDLSDRIRVNTNLTQEYLSSVRNYLKATAGDGVEYSAAAYLRNTRQDVGSIMSYLVANGGDGVPYPAASWLKSAVVELRSIDTYSGYIRTNTNLTQEKLSTVSSLTERAGNFLKAKADDGVEYSAASYLHTLAKNSNILLGYSKSKGSDGVDYSFTGFLNMIAERTRNISTSFDKLLGSSSVDLSETNSLLGRLTADVAGIRDKFVLQDSLSDLLDLLVGDMQVPQTQAAISRIQDVMSTRFPFCVPSVVNAVLFGSLLADPAPPVWTFDVGGSPLVVDFADYGAFAEVSSWTVRLLFTAALLLNTRRFVYGVGGGD